MEKLLSSLSSVCKGKLQTLLISTNRLKAEFPWWLLELSFPNNRDHMDYQLSALLSYCVLSGNTNLFIQNRQ